MSPRTPSLVSPYDHWEEAEGYARRGFGVIPLISGTKRAPVPWKKYQTQAPTPDEVDRWWRAWPDAGMAVVLGPVSGVFAVDVDGPDAHAELVRRLGKEPVAPKILTGSRKPFRYQLLFRHPPGLPGRARITPWHPRLEFRGRGGLSVLPPSVHKSGRRYGWAPGGSLDELELPELPPLIGDALQARADVDAGRGAVSRPGVVVPAGLPAGVQQRALALITEKLTAVEGKGDDKVTFTAACCLVRDFGLSVEDALPVITAWNSTNCTPRWAVDELLRKLRKAEELPGPRGRLLGGAGAGRTEIADTPKAIALSPCPSGRTPSTAAIDSDRPPLLVSVPDWVLSCWPLVRPTEPPVRRGRPPVARKEITGLILANVVLQKSSVVRLPDVALAQLVWGGGRVRWPERWRAKLAIRLRRLGGMDSHWEGRGCPTACPLHASDARPHRHVRFRLEADNWLAFYSPFATEGTVEGGITYAFEGLRSHHPDTEAAKSKTKQIRERRKKGELCSVYLPAWVFGPLTLPPGPCRVLKAVTHELTRLRGARSERPDRAEVIAGAPIPLLAKTKSYVGFNGNGGRKRPQYHGRGYSLGEWMKRAGYPHDPGAAPFRAAAGEFLGDLKSLSEPLGLVAAARVPGREGWSDIDAAIADVAVVRPRRLARECLLRVYGPADYSDRWRAYFASEIGLSTIPRGEPGEAGQTPSGAAIATGEQLARWMRSAGLTDAGLAERLGVSRTLVCKYRTGSRPLSRGFGMKLAQLAAIRVGRGGGQV